MEPGTRAPICLITGLSSILGNSLIHRLLARNATVVLADTLDGLSRESLLQLRELYDGDRVFRFPCNLKSPDSINRCVRELYAIFSRIDILINCPPDPDDASATREQRLAANLFGPLCLIQAVADLLRQSPNGRIFVVDDSINRVRRGLIGNGDSGEALRETEMARLLLGGSVMQYQSDCIRAGLILSAGESSSRFNGVGRRWQSGRNRIARKNGHLIADFVLDPEALKTPDLYYTIGRNELKAYPFNFFQSASSASSSHRAYLSLMSGSSSA